MMQGFKINKVTIVIYFIAVLIMDLFVWPTIDSECSRDGQVNAQIVLRL